MKLFESNYTFPHSWSILTAATWRKYPNDLSAHVLSCDVVGRSYDPVSGKLRTERLICCKQNAPAILRRLGLPIPELAYFREVSEVNPKTLVHEAKTYNLTLRNILTVEETCRYTPVLIGRSGGGSGSTGGGGTHFSQTCQVTSSWAAVGNYIEAAAVSSFSAGSAKGREALELVITKLTDEAREHLSNGFDGLRRDFEIFCEPAPAAKHSSSSSTNSSAS